MAQIDTVKPKPNMNNEYMFRITPCLDGKIGLVDMSRYLEPYNGKDRDRSISKVTHEIHGKTATVYIIDDYEIATRTEAIKLARGFINGNFDTYRLD